MPQGFSEFSQEEEARFGWLQRYREVRAFTERLCEPLATEDYVVQSMMDASPAKWHLAHTSWFFENFILKKQDASYQSICPEYAYLFNSYYNLAGPMHRRDLRGLISRPTVQQTYEYRREVDAAMENLLRCSSGERFAGFVHLVELGLHHEQQHQELLLADLKHMLAQNPLWPAYRPRAPEVAREAPSTASWIGVEGGLRWIGHDGPGFAYDNEGPRHRVFLENFQVSGRLVTNAEFLAFIEEKGYQRPELWLSLGWQALQQNHWRHPLYWVAREGKWFEFTLAGLRELNPAEPACHLSYFEADAYARWAGARLPTEAEWEVAAAELEIEGHFAETGRFHPAPLDREDTGCGQFYGDTWEWTSSAYLPYPGYSPPAGAVGEYNGKFMCNQMVLRGGSCATSRSHIRPTYRNFFPPEKQWQFTGIRLAKGAA